MLSTSRPRVCRQVHARGQLYTKWGTRPYYTGNISSGPQIESIFILVAVELKSIATHVERNTNSVLRQMLISRRGMRRRGI